MTDLDSAFARVRSRTRYEGQPVPDDELLADEIERLRARVRLRDDLLDWCELRLSLAWVDYVRRQRRALENDRG